MTTRTSRTLEELVELQDKAITALETALKATQLALEAMQRARTEQGTPIKIDWPVPQPSPNTAPSPYVPYIVPQPWGGTKEWGTTVICTSTANASGVAPDYAAQWNKAQLAMDMAGKVSYAIQSEGNFSVSEGGNFGEHR
jgi:hypothetical protein